MDIRELIPKHKQDYGRVEQLKTKTLEEMKPILPDLLKWLQDMNWPIAQDIENIVINYQEDLLPHLKEIFNTNDGEWKYFILHGLVSRLPKHIIKELKPDLIRMKDFPTKDEIVSEINDIVTELLEKS
ncbi:DUF5071 domain-containing protein [Paenibacillus puldeungensis]|uniref:DUF5071 domain-containing protein n=1 Tax=Paenibacillus puldeungensis TaxID=696536 RepID=A0ABW3S1H2_9BACL